MTPTMVRPVKTTMSLSHVTKRQNGVRIVYMDTVKSNVDLMVNTETISITIKIW